MFCASIYPRHSFGRAALLLVSSDPAPAVVMLSLERRRGRSPQHQHQGATTHLRMVVEWLTSSQGQSRSVAQQQHKHQQQQQKEKEKEPVCETSTAAKCPTPPPLNHFGMPIKPQKLRASSLVRCWTVEKVTTKTCSTLCFVPHVYGSHKSLSFTDTLNLVLLLTIVSSSDTLWLHFLILFLLQKLGNQGEILCTAVQFC